MVSNLDSAKLSFEAFKRRDAEAYLSYFAEDVEWQVSAFVTGHTEYRGREGIRRFLGELERLERDQGELLAMELTSFEQLPDGRVIACGEARIERESDPLEFDAAAIYSFGEDGKITRLEGFTTHEEARRAAGLE